MNDRERRVKAVFEKDGWEVIRNGAPDFFAIKGGQVIAIEVKSPTDGLSSEQQKVKEVLEKACIPYRTVVPDMGATV